MAYMGWERYYRYRGACQQTTIVCKVHLKFLTTYRSDGCSETAQPANEREVTARLRALSKYKTNPVPVMVKTPFNRH